MQLNGKSISRRPQFHQCGDPPTWSAYWLMDAYGISGSVSCFSPSPVLQDSILDGFFGVGCWLICSCEWLMRMISSLGCQFVFWIDWWIWFQLEGSKDRLNVGCGWLWEATTRPSRPWNFAVTKLCTVRSARPELEPGFHPMHGFPHGFPLLFPCETRRWRRLLGGL